MSTCLASARAAPKNGGPTHFPGFDLLRLLAAAAVLLSHSYLIADRGESNEPLVRLLGPGNILGHYGVFTFFIISGFLLARSLSYRPSAVIYVTNRSLRILPAFIACTLVTMLLIGPAFSSLGFGAYFTDPGTFGFLVKSLNTLGDQPLPGLFAYADDKLGGAVNGSLWSLGYEALSYLFLFMAWTLLRKSWPVAILLVVVAAATWIEPWVAYALPGIAYTLPYFAGGVFMHGFHRKFGSRSIPAVICAAALIASGFAGFQAYAFAVFGAYLVVFFGEHVTFGSRWIARMGDCSYGLYLYGWPVQQMIMQLTGTREPLVLFAISLPAALFLGWLSCHLVELPAMRLRKPLAARLSAMAGKVFTAMGRGGSVGLQTAKVTFVMAGLLILTSRKQWYEFMESMLIIMAATITTACAAGFASMALRERVPAAAVADDD